MVISLEGVWASPGMTNEISDSRRKESFQHLSVKSPRVQARSRSSGFNTVCCLGPDSLCLPLPAVSPTGVPNLRLLASPWWPTFFTWVSDGWVIAVHPATGRALMSVLVTQMHPSKPAYTPHPRPRKALSEGQVHTQRTRLAPSLRCPDSIPLHLFLPLWRPGPHSQDCSVGQGSSAKSADLLPHKASDPRPFAKQAKINS